MASWATYIRTFRRSQQLTQDEAAKLLGVSQPTLSRWEAGKQVPDPGSRRRIQEIVETLSGSRRRLLEEVVRRSPMPQALVDCELHLFAVSEPLRDVAAARPEVSAPEQLLGEEVGETLQLLRQAGLERGEVAFAECVATLRRARPAPRYMRQLWIPVPQSANRPLLRVEMAEIDRAGFEARLQREPRVAITTLAELLRARCGPQPSATGSGADPTIDRTPGS